MAGRFQNSRPGGEGGIRTHDRLAPITVFELGGAVREGPSGAVPSASAVRSWWLVSGRAGRCWSAVHMECTRAGGQAGSSRGSADRYVQVLDLAVGLVGLPPPRAKADRLPRPPAPFLHPAPPPPPP